MTVTKEFGHRKSSRPVPQPQRSGLSLPLVAAALGAFAIGGGAVFGWDQLPAFGQWSPLKLFASRSLSHPERLGRATTAPLLRICLTPQMLNIRHEQDIAPGILLEAIEGDPRGRLSRNHTKPREHAVLDTAQIWGEVADCVYRQNSYKFCDIDNRAFAVKAANAFIGQADRIIAQPQSKYAADNGDVPALSAVRERVVEALRARLRNGALIKEDFEGGVPVGVARVLVDTETTGNECAKQ
jgi:hypothetical protein